MPLLLSTYLREQPQYFNAIMTMFYRHLYSFQELPAPVLISDPWLHFQGFLFHTAFYESDYDLAAEFYYFLDTFMSDEQLRQKTDGILPMPVELIYP